MLTVFAITNKATGEFLRRTRLYHRIIDARRRFTERLTEGEKDQWHIVEFELKFVGVRAQKKWQEQQSGSV